jgi:hypothetical protein
MSLNVVLTMDAYDVSVSQIAYVVIGESSPTEKDVLVRAEDGCKIAEVMRMI